MVDGTDEKTPTPNVGGTNDKEVISSTDSHSQKAQSFIEATELPIVIDVNALQ